jgi:hypothetical protein
VAIPPGRFPPPPPGLCARPPPGRLFGTNEPPPDGRFVDCPGRAPLMDGEPWKDPRPPPPPPTAPRAPPAPPPPPRPRWDQE